MLESRTKMSRYLFGRPSFANLESFKQSQQTTVHSLTASPSEISARNSKSKICTSHHAIPKSMDRQRQQCWSKPKKIIPTEIGFPTIWTIIRGQKDENLEIERNLDWVDEVKENASIQMTAYQQMTATHYNRKARPRVFKVRNTCHQESFRKLHRKGSREVPSKLRRPLHCL
ncbi:hypothetical protein CK203_014185 [Vitis vinifera]|uniref:Uncharacterized protein n=1 Tax=Vitis vinifera TaxID=29760 RepID=A0A438JHW8_VITVI|nr:hypothetical protein CK203_014185 [Vitis vinifera]